jgi:hypothetical protein
LQPRQCECERWCKLQRVRKDGSNKGRLFFACPVGTGSGGVSAHGGTESRCVRVASVATHHEPTRPGQTDDFPSGGARLRVQCCLALSDSYGTVWLHVTQGGAPRWLWAVPMGGWRFPSLRAPRTTEYASTCAEAGAHEWALFLRVHSATGLLLLQVGAPCVPCEALGRAGGQTTSI